MVNLLPCSMSTIRYTEIDLTALIEESNVIVAVEFLENFAESLSVPKKPGEADVPPFIKKGFVFKVVEVLKNKDNVKIGEQIQVPEEKWRRSFGQHKETYAGGKSKSYEVKKYEADVPSMKKADVLFLYHFQGMFELTAKDSFISNAVRDKLEILLSA